MEIKDDEQKCPFCAEVIKSEAKICRFCNKPLPGTESVPGTEPLPGTEPVKASKGGGRILPFSLLVLALLAFIYGSPYQALSSLRQELSNGQADKLDQDIDYTSVREGLKRDFRAMAVGEVEDDPSIKHKLLGMLGLAIGAPVADAAVDYVVSPAGLRDVLQGVVPLLSRGRSLNDGDSGASASAAPGSASDNVKSTKCQYIGLNQFVATITNRSGSATALTFSRRGILSWQVTHIRLVRP